MRTRSWVSSEQLGERQWMEAINIEGKGWSIVQRKWSPALHEESIFYSRHSRHMEIEDEVTGAIKNSGLSFFEAVDELAKFDMVQEEVHSGMEDAFDASVLEQDYFYRNFAEREAIAFDANGLPHPTVNGRVISEETFSGFTPDQVQERHDEKAAAIASYVTILDPNDLTVDAPDLYEEYESLSEISRQLHLSAHYFQLCFQDGWHVDPKCKEKPESNSHRRTSHREYAENYWDKANNEAKHIRGGDRASISAMLANSAKRLISLYRFYYCVSAASAIGIGRHNAPQNPHEHHERDEHFLNFYTRRNQSDYIARAVRNLQKLGVNEEKAKHYVRYSVMKAIHDGEVTYPQDKIAPLMTWMEKTLGKMMQDAAIASLDEVIDLREVSLPFPELGDEAKARKATRSEVQTAQKESKATPAP
jgi:hypothetical protein